MNLKTLLSSLLLCTCFLCTTITNAQTPDHLIKGIITGKNGNPLPGVTVQVKGQATEMAQTNPDGTFSLYTKSVSGILVCSNVGYAIKEIAFGENNYTLTVTLEESVSVLNEVVLTG